MILFFLLFRLFWVESHFYHGFLSFPKGLFHLLSSRVGILHLRRVGLGVEVHHGEGELVRHLRLIVVGDRMGVHLVEDQMDGRLVFLLLVDREVVVRMGELLVVLVLDGMVVHVSVVHGLVVHDLMVRGLVVHSLEVHGVVVFLQPSS